ncbi:MAG: LysE family translocator [Gorillibacterium sp.]|nr:LysE family translocator [Gorillibacterium sp.]
MTPGTDTFYIMGRTISQGRSSGLISVLGTISGAFAHTLFAVLGLSVLLAKSALAFSIVKWLGAGYLLYLGFKSLRAKGENEGNLVQLEKSVLKKVYLNGFLTNLLNPKVALFYLAFLPQFIRADNPYGGLPFLLLGLTFITTLTIWYSLLVLFSDLATRRMRRSKNVSVYLNKLAGVIFIGLGIKVLLSVKPAN